jgi:response regulator RpfG family c-di-GMP phosphodiesterase
VGGIATHPGNRASKLMKDTQEQGFQDSLGERTILVIDDSEAVRTALDVLLSMSGARVVGSDSASMRSRANPSTS